MNNSLMLKGMLAASIVCGFALVYLLALDGTVIHPIVKWGRVEVVGVYRPGATVYADTSVCIYRDIPSLVTWTLVSDDRNQKTLYEKRTEYIGRGCSEDLLPIEELSPRIVPGVYHFIGEHYYRINPLRTIVIGIETNSFVVR